MPHSKSMIELHRSAHINWLRAAVLGANDGIVSTSSLIVGVAAANASSESILLTGVAGLVAGAMSMAAGEYVSVSSQADTENADLAKEREELENNLEFEHEELAQIYVGRGLDVELARKVAVQLMKHDAIGSHARDELGITEQLSANPIQAAVASAVSFAAGAVCPLIAAYLTPVSMVVPVVAVTSLIFLATLGITSAQVGGANIWRAAARVTFWGVAAMGITAIVGSVFGAAV